MRETQFIKQNQEKWVAFEQDLSDDFSHKDAEQVADMYVQVTDDLSHARTFYPSRSVRVYLNGLAQMVTTSVNLRQRFSFQRIRAFFMDELPMVVYQSRLAFGLAVSFFLISVVIGYFSSMMDEAFPSHVLGDGYVRMTRENIQSGDPLAVYKQSPFAEMTFGIMFNNLKVAFMYFIRGIFAGIASAASLMFEGVRVGAFLQFFSRYDLFAKANLTIWMHGTLEISAIIIGAAAGMVMGSGWLFPGTYTRLQSFQLAARRAVKIMMGVVVMLVIAAIIEGCLTRFTEAGDLFRGSFISFWLIAILAYYGWYPFYKARVGTKNPIRSHVLPPTTRFAIKFDAIKSIGEIFSETFWLLKNHLGYFCRVALLTGAGYLTLVYTVLNNVRYDRNWSTVLQMRSFFLQQQQAMNEFFNNKDIHYLWLLNGFAFSVIAYAALIVVMRQEKNMTKTRTQHVVAFLQIFALQTMFFGLANWCGSVVTFLLLWFAFSWLGIVLALSYFEGKNIFASIGRGFRLLGSDAGSVFSLNVLAALLGWFFYGIVSSGFLWMQFEMLGWNFSFKNEDGSAIAAVLAASIGIFSLFLTACWFYLSSALLYFSLKEIREANSLYARTQAVGTARKIRGIARE
ncbi:MAG: hypothetical protein RL757_3397 [Bacteroidota bacterium]|jgi:uncharacterized membrane protein SpoIIM required for sporulation